MNENICKYYLHHISLFVMNRQYFAGISTGNFNGSFIALHFTYSIKGFNIISSLNEPFHQFYFGDSLSDISEFEW